MRAPRLEGRDPAIPPRRPSWKLYGGTLLVVAACTLVAELLQREFDRSNLTMLYLAGVVVCAVAFGRGPAMLSAFLSVAVFNFCFVPPRFTFQVADSQYLVTFAVMLLVAAVIGTLTAGLREQLETSRGLERRTSALYRLSQDLAACTTEEQVLQATVARTSEILEDRVAVLLPDGQRHVRGTPDDAAMPEAERRTAQYAFENSQIAGLGRTGGPSSMLHLPLEASGRVLGVLSAASGGAPRRGDRVQLLRAFASQTALALERCRLASAADREQARADREQMRTALLSSVSHDLRTPLASITGAASTLRDDHGRFSEATRREMAHTIAEEAQRLNRRIENLLDMTRLEMGALRVRKSWHSLEEVVGAALVRLETLLGDRPVAVSIAADFPLVPLDDVLFEQVVWNLVENAHKHSPESAPVELRATREPSGLRLEVGDRGPGLKPGEERRVFEKFYQGAAARSGAGLGLAICEGIVAAHGGRIEAANRPGGGAVFSVWLPIEGEPPAVERELPGEAIVADRA